MLVLLSGCATMSKEECKQADWYIKGVEDATKGFPLDRVIEHGKACARIKITPDMKEYREGHAKGARLYCVPEKGYSEGRDGAAYNGICPVELEPKFLRAYRDGQELYRIQQNMNRMLNEINGNNSQIDSYYNEISRLKYEIVNSRDENDRRYKMRRIDELEQDIRNLSLNADRAARELELFKNDYRVVEDKHRRMGYL
ncbi:DNA repair ATPase [Cellvibrio zantedeschiae]|uniref:DNA repair ATPase n=2 Tax=Cellvibrio zantedeschiae TaxID=1237077 RepID=A0ABQ3BEC2_9GAMM|nr:DNA repair ATPase [Cellvibrio zantedeschiae]